MELTSLGTDWGPPFSAEGYASRLARIKAEMVARDIDLLIVSAPEGLNYVSSFLCEWYQGQSPAIWPPAKVK